MNKLKAYQSKRELQKTPEPKAKIIRRSKGALLFTIQKHAASHLHYDLRLEVNGVLKSWAVPKGPSLNPADKRLAIQVEDHPFDYHSFEGIIPQGNYGAGTVMLWDHGTYTTPSANPSANTRDENEKRVTEGLRKGHLTFILQGEKLQGEFSLVDLKRDNQWLLIKKADAFAKKISSVKEDLSVKTGRTMQEIAERKSPSTQAKNPPKEDSPEFDEQLKSAPKKAMPKEIHPMLAVLLDKPFNRKEWLFEIKWDGYRALAHVKKKQVKLNSRNQQSFNQRFPEIVQELQQLNIEALLDGEIVILDKQGKPQFQWLQNYQRNQRGTPVYYVFDLLYLNGHDLRELPLLQRKALLKKLLPSSSRAKVRFNDHITEKGIAFFKKAATQGLEGIIGKDEKSPYVMQRSPYWVKIKTHLRQEVVIGGFTQPRGSRKKLGALLVGVYQKGDLVYVGHVGGGFNAQSLSEVYQKLEPLIRSASPFKNPPKPNAPVTWIKPQLVCEVEFAEWTDEGIMRQPIFKGLRTDKKSREVIREIATSLRKK